MTLLPSAFRTFGREGEWYAQVGNRIVGPWAMRGYAQAGLQTEMRRMHKIGGEMVTARVLRELSILFPSFEAAEDFGAWCSGYFYGTPKVSGGVEVAPPRVRLRGLMAGEAPMFGREAAKTGGLIEIQQESTCQTI